MSRIGKNPVAIPAGVEVTVGEQIVVKGPLGTLKTAANPAVKVAVEAQGITVAKVDGAANAVGTLTEEAGVVAIAGRAVVGLQSLQIDIAGGRDAYALRAFNFAAGQLYVAAALAGIAIGNDGHFAACADGAATVAFAAAGSGVAC